MENKEKQIKEDPKNQQQVQIGPAAESLSEAELEKAAGGASTGGYMKATSRISDESQLSESNQT
jgi:hypothetical protein